MLYFLLVDSNYQLKKFTQKKKTKKHQRKKPRPFFSGYIFSRVKKNLIYSNFFLKVS